MPTFQLSLFGNASIGVYALATELMAVIPSQVSELKVQKIEDWLKAKVIQTTIGDSLLIGALACANSNGIILPSFVREEEVQAIKSALDINVAVMDSKKTAFGNLILANDYGAVVDNCLKSSDVKKISDTLGVEAAHGEIAGLPCVGSLAVVTNKGALTHPSLNEEERKVLMNILKVRVDVGTVNNGIPYVSTGIIGNEHGVITGVITTGPELLIIGNALNVV